MFAPTPKIEYTRTIVRYILLVAGTPEVYGMFIVVVDVLATNMQLASCSTVCKNLPRERHNCIFKASRNETLSRQLVACKPPQR